MNKCPQCSSPVLPGTAFCDSCGASQTQSAPTLVASASAPAASAPAASAPAASAPAASGGSRCPQCSAKVVPGQAYCDDCGSSLADVQSAPAPAPSVPAPAPAPAPAPSAQAPVPPSVAPIPQAQPNSPPSFAKQPPAPQAPQAPQAPSAAPAAPAAQGHTCSACGTPNKPGYAFCDNCGASLVAKQAAAPSADAAAPSVAAPPPPPAMKKAKVIVANSGTEFDLVGKSEFLIGREDPVSGIFPEIDMTYHRGVEGGVSRRHAKIIKQGDQWMIQDLKSTNHTYINRKRLNPGQPEFLNDGDQIRVGRVALTFMNS